MHLRIKILDLPELVEIFGQGAFSFSFSGKTVKELIQALVSRYGPALSKVMLDSEGNLNTAIQMVVEGQLCGQATKPIFLKDGDQVSFVVFLEGG